MAKQESILLHVLGCGDAFNSGGRRHTSFLLKKEGSHILIDCGATTLLAMKKEGISPSDIDYIVLTHFHGDHYAGLPFLLLEAAKIEKRERPLTLISPPGLEERLQRLFSLLYPGSEDSLNSFPIYYKSFEQEKPLPMPFGNITAFEVSHSPGTLPHAVRLELGEKVFAYSGDTGWNDHLPELAREADLFICECNFFETESPAHLNYGRLQKKKEQFTAKKILLTHLGTDMLKKESELDWETLKDGSKISF